jgi:hypothetical protein
MDRVDKFLIGLSVLGVTGAIIGVAVIMMLI